jgi:hypothetical protein
VSGAPEGQVPARAQQLPGPLGNGGDSQAVAANTRSKASRPGGRQVSKAASMTSTPAKPARLRLAAAASSGPISTHVIRKPRRASGTVAFPVAHPISRSRSPDRRSARCTS